jgi:hypothetical protein
MNIIQLDYEMDLFYHMDSFLDYSVDYLGDRFLNIKMSDIVDRIKDLNEFYSDKVVTDDDIFLNYTQGNEEQFYNELLDDLYDDEKENFKNLQDFVDEYGGLELLEMFIETDNNMSDLCEINNCRFGTVGYSDWTYYITHEKIEHSFVLDLWEGRNWYILSLIQNNEVVDSIGGMYITDLKKLDEHVKDNFGIDKDDYFVVENDIGQYIDKPKVREIKGV